MNLGLNPLEQLLLYAALRAAWSVRRLHEDYRDVYDPAALQAYLGPQRTTHRLGDTREAMYRDCRSHHQEVDHG